MNRLITTAIAIAIGTAVGLPTARATLFVVTRGSDTDDGACDGHCTLREAINAANDLAGLDTIGFNIDTRDPSIIPTISPVSPLPSITSPAVIDATTQFAGRVQLNGENAGVDANGLRITAGGSTVRGLVINRFDGNGILLVTGGGNTIQGNFIGTNITGTVALPNGDVGSGVRISNSPDNLIGGSQSAQRNLISGGHPGYGVWIFGTSATGNRVLGNYIGTNVAGTAPLPNLIGVNIWASNNTIGGPQPGEGNVISGNRYGANIEIFDGGSGASGNRIQGNFIGTNITGTVAL
ncbi:MAG: CSLREA domain-containing protein, partial [Phycisphaerales bacterium]|nr:CSLREA domain-containing protein [Phycisphaerales bacterium]